MALIFEIERQPHTLTSSGCSICRLHGPLGVDCGHCGHHFHIGTSLLIGQDMIRCPRCETGWYPWTCR